MSNSESLRTSTNKDPISPGLSGYTAPRATVSVCKWLSNMLLLPCTATWWQEWVQCAHCWRKEKVSWYGSWWTTSERRRRGTTERRKDQRAAERSYMLHRQIRRETKVDTIVKVQERRTDSLCQTFMPQNIPMYSENMLQLTRTPIQWNVSLWIKAGRLE